MVPTNPPRMDYGRILPLLPATMDELINKLGSTRARVNVALQYYKKLGVVFRSGRRAPNSNTRRGPRSARMWDRVGAPQ